MSEKYDKSFLNAVENWIKNKKFILEASGKYTCLLKNGNYRHKPLMSGDALWGAGVKESAKGQIIFIFTTSSGAADISQVEILSDKAFKAMSSFGKAYQEFVANYDDESSADEEIEELMNSEERLSKLPTWGTW